jgi:predicted ArsR family transcriptional regulator
MQAMASPPLRRRVLAGLTRSGLLAALRQADGSIGVRELAETVGLHPNSVREQLGQLVDGGRVSRSIAPLVGRGRPSFRYVAEPEDGDPDPNAYRELARVLADAIDCIVKLLDEAGDLCAAHLGRREGAVDG